MENNFSVEIVESSRELSKVEKVRMKDTADCQKLDELSKEGEVVITPSDYAILSVHAVTQRGACDYRNLVIVDAVGRKYCTGSEPFIRSFLDIFGELKGEDYQIKVVRKPSKNFSGKEFLTCSIA